MKSHDVEQATHELLREYVRSRGTSVDPKAGVIRGVKVLGLTSRNGRTYTESALREAAALYEGAKVNVNHPKGGPSSPRDYEERLGSIESVRFQEGEGLFADLRFNPKHPIAEQLAWDAEHAPHNVGLSHNVEARTTRREGRTIVEAITRVLGVDLVADPAATAGLYEADGAGTVAGLTADALRDTRPDLVEQLHEGADREIASLRDEVAQLQLESAGLLRRVLVAELLSEHGLPPEGRDAHTDSPTVSEAFAEALYHADSEADVRRLVTERAALVHRLLRDGVSGSVVSRDQFAVEAGQSMVTDGATFAASLR